MSQKIGMNHQIYSIDQVFEIVKGIGKSFSNANRHIDTLGYDSRKLHRAEHTLFFALKGVRDGHRYIESAYLAGVRNFVVTDPGYMDEKWLRAKGWMADINVILVEDALRAIQKLAAFHRSRFDYPVLAITGSNGKTVVKDWLFQLLSPEKKIIRSPKSFNSQLGVALSLWQMDASYDMAIVEAGISQVGEMERLAEMIRPEIAVLTTLGSAHDAGFASLEEKASEKAKLFETAHQIVCPLGIIPAKTRESLLTDLESPLEDQHSLNGRELWSWGRSGAAAYPYDKITILESVKEHEDHGGSDQQGWSRITARVRDQAGDQTIRIPFVDSASVENAMTCWVVMLMLGYDQETIRQRMERLQVMEMRLELKQGIHQSSVIDDSYSNDLSSLRIALDLLRQQHQHPYKTLILSDLPEVTGRPQELDLLYHEVIGLLGDQGLNRLITVGPALAKRKGMIPVEEHIAYLTTSELVAALPGLSWNNHTILIKGARKYAFERVSSALVAKTHRTVLEINMSAMAHNISQFKGLLPAHVKLMMMVKAFSYGSGTFEVANMLQFHGVDYLAVAYADEGVQLRQAGITLPIMVMSPDPSAFDVMCQYKLEPEIFGFSILEQWCNVLQEKGMDKYPVHIKLDTGMHRLGFGKAEIPRLLERLQRAHQIRISSVFSHLAASGEPQHDQFTAHQIDVFQSISIQLEQGLGYPVIKHIANTDAIYRHPNAHFDMVRLGLGLYGLDSGSGLDLWPVMQLKCKITQIRQLPKGETVGYNRKGKLDRDSRIATVQIGYADGYDRRFGNGIGKMLVQGCPVYTIGDICMDMCMLDVTDFEQITEGDEVLVYGDLKEMAQAIGTIPYELMVNVSQRVKRIYYYG